MRWKIGASQLGKYERKLAGQQRKHVTAAKMQAAKASVRLLKDRTKTAPPGNPSGVGGPPIWRGKFLRGWFVMKQGTKIIIGNRVKYAGVIEAGRKPGATQPPTRALVPWVRSRLGIPPQRMWEVAFLVARAISQRGLKGRHIVRDAMPDILDIYDTAMRAAVDKALKEAR